MRRMMRLLTVQSWFKHNGKLYVKITDIGSYHFKEGKEGPRIVAQATAFCVTDGMVVYLDPTQPVTPVNTPRPISSLRCKFRDLRPGECFAMGGSFHLRVREVNFCHVRGGLGPHHYSPVNAFNVSDQWKLYVHVDDSTEVTRVALPPL